MVSTHRLESPDRALLAERIAKVIAHEAGHLADRRQCRDPECVMHPAHTAADLDAWGLAVCACCRRLRFPCRMVLAMITALLLLSLTAGAALKFLTRKPGPFKWRADGSRTSVCYPGEPVVRLRSADQARSAAAVLNRLFANRDRAPLAISSGPATARVQAGGELLFVVDPTVSEGYDPAEFARPLGHPHGTADSGQGPGRAELPGLSWFPSERGSGSRSQAAGVVEMIRCEAT